MIHTSREPPLDLQRKTSGEDQRALTLWRRHGRRRGRQGIPLTLHTQETRDEGCPQSSTGRRARWQERTVSRTTLAWCPLTKVPAPHQERRRHARNDDPGLWISTVVTLKSKTSTSFPSKPRSPCTERASRGRTMPDRPPSCRTCGRRRVKINVRRGNTARALGSDPAHARTSLDNTSDEAPKLQVEEPTSFFSDTGWNKDNSRAEHGRAT